jgi:hypothetical protein
MQTIYTDDNSGVRIELSEEYSSEFVYFAENIVWGNEGLKFSMKGLAIDFRNFSKPYFISLYVNNQLTAISIINHKLLSINQKETDVFYSCLWGAELSKRSQGYCTLMMEEVNKYLFETYSNALIYAYVEKKNPVARRVAQKTGFRSFADFKVASAVHFVPTPNKYCGLLSPSSKSAMIRLLDELYKNRILNDVKYTFDESCYFVYEDNNVIKAGIQVKKMRWSVLNMDGMRGYVLLKLYPKIPLLSKYFDPSEFSYLCVGNIYFTESQSFNVLLDAVMHHYNINTCIAYGLSDSPIDSQILKCMSQGLLSAADAQAAMYVKSNNISLSSLGRFPFLSICDSL